MSEPEILTVQIRNRARRRAVMTGMSVRHWSTPLLAAGLLASSSACAFNIDHEAYIEREEKRFPAETLVDLRLDTFDGSVEVRSWDRAEVLVEVEKRGLDKEAVSKIEVVADRQGNTIRVDARQKERGHVVGIGWITSPSARLIATVPRKCNVSAHTRDGAITLSRVEGKFELRSGDGSVKAVETTGELTIETGDGSITLEDVSGRIDARTKDGSVNMSGTPSGLRVRTGDGSVVLRIRRGAAMTEDWSVTTGDGSIVAELPDDFNASIEADPGSDGRARNELKLTSVTGGGRDNRVLRGQLGQGGRAFRLQTGDGTIRLRGY